jgi:hypothetical protein
MNKKILSIVCRITPVALAIGLLWGFAGFRMVKRYEFLPREYFLIFSMTKG